MPVVSPAERLAHMPALDWSRVRLTPAEAAEKGNLARGGGRVVLQTVNGQPVYRFTGRGRTTVLADTGDVLDDATEPETMAIAARFLNVDASSLRHVGVLTEPDQWTIGNRRQMPLHKIVADDAARTELYVSEPLSEVAVATTRRSRALAWVGAIPHWLYFVELRRNDSAWRQVILWTSGAGSVLALHRPRARDRAVPDAICRADALALRDGRRVRRLHAHVGLQRHAVHAAVGLDDDRGRIRRGSQAGVHGPRR